MFFLVLLFIVFAVIAFFAIFILFDSFREKKLFYTKDICSICGKQTGIQGNRRYVHCDGCVCEQCLQALGKNNAAGALLYKNCSVHDVKIDAAINAYAAARNCGNHFQEKSNLIESHNKSIVETRIPQSKKEAEMIAPQLLKQVAESVTLINTTKKPSVFFERYDFFLNALKRLASCEKWIHFNGALPSYTLQNAERDRSEQTRLFILRYAQETREKMYQLKTPRAKMNKAESYYNTLTEYSNVMSDEHIPLLTEQYEVLKRIAQQPIE